MNKTDTEDKETPVRESYLSLCTAVCIAGFGASMLLISNALANDLTNSKESLQLLLWAEVTHQIGKTKELPSGRLTQRSLDVLNDTGKALFRVQFTSADGAGPSKLPQAIVATKTDESSEYRFSRTVGPHAPACASCHNQPVLGGASDFVIHEFVSDTSSRTDIDSVDQQFLNERGTNHLMGAGLVELLAREMSRDLADIRRTALQQASSSEQPVRLELVTKEVSFGYISATPDGLLNLNEVDGVDDDLTVRPFSQKGEVTSLRQFTVNALNHHHDMRAQERFGLQATGEEDFDGDGHANELSAADVSALVAWQAMLEPPVQDIPEGQGWAQAAARGEMAMGEYGCTVCHRAALALDSLDFLDPGPLDVAGTLSSQSVESPAIYDLSLTYWAGLLPRNERGQVLVPLFGDLKRHQMSDQQNGGTRFITAELWGVGSTSPYGYRNNYMTLRDVILAHGGDAKASRDAFDSGDARAQSDVIAFLKTLVIEQ